MSAAQSMPSGSTGETTGPVLLPDASQEEPGSSDDVPPLSQVRRLRLLGISGAVSSARSFTRQALIDWGWLPTVSPERAAAAEDVLLVVSELVTNACLHTDGPDELRVGYGPGLLRIEVTDPVAEAPAPRVSRVPGRPGGHGIFIVQRLCRDWGVVSHPDGAGKTVWVDLPGLAC